MGDLIARYLIHHVEENGPLDLTCGRKAERRPNEAWLSDSDDSSDKRTKEEKVFDALKWITPVLEQHNISYRVTGGVAARIHGATRPLWDIDIDMSDADLDKLASVDDVQERLQELGTSKPMR